MRVIFLLCTVALTILQVIIYKFNYYKMVYFITHFITNIIFIKVYANFVKAFGLSICTKNSDISTTYV